MTISTQITKRTYQGNGVNRVWEVDFPLLAADDLHVYITSPSGQETELSAAYSLNALRTELTYPTEASGLAPLASGWRITLLRATPLTQEIDLTRQGELDAEVLEKGYDKLTLLVQEIKEVLSRTIKLAVSSSVSPADSETFLRKLAEAQSAAETACAVWGNISGTLSNQTDLQNALNAKQNTLTAGAGLSISGDVISNTQVSAVWGNLTGTLSSQTDLQNALNAKQAALTAGNHITLADNVISTSAAAVIVRDWSVE